MRLFDCFLIRKRIEKKRNELLRQRLELNAKKNGLRQSCNPKEYAKVIIADLDLRDDINLLEGLLKP